MNAPSSRIFFVVLALALAACAPAAPSAGRPSANSEQSAATEPGAPARTLVAAVRVEPLTLATRSLREQGVAVYLSSRMFNAEIGTLDDEGNPRPYLVEEFPKLNTETWKVSPNGTMETTYRLKPDLVWHDGAPLTAQDFVFSWRLYSTPELGAVGLPMSIIDDVQAVDDRTFTVRWKQPYPDAESFTTRNAGFQKGPDGMYTSPTAGRFHGEVTTNAATDNEAELSILARDWRDAGFDIQEVVVPAGMERDPQLRASFPGLWVQNTSAGESAVLNHTSSRIPTPQNRYQGGNRGGWSNADFDRLADAYSTELDRSKRSQLLVDMTKIQADDLPALSLFFVTQPWAFTSALTGPKLVAPDSNMSWNIETWEFR